jgi:DNA-binding NtrC family response regulator
MGHTVLIVDSDANARIITETLLHLRGIDVCATADAIEAQAILAQRDVGVVLMNMCTPDAYTSDILRQLRKSTAPEETSPAPRLIVVSDRMEPEIELFAERLGAAAFLRKPVEPARLIATVERLLGMQRVQAAG